jgi:hypothetical protein
MAHFAQLDENSIVTNVIVVSSDDCLDSDGSESKLGIPFCKNLLGADTNWVQTKEDGSIRFRYAGIGMKYDSTNDVFYEQQPYPSWVLDTSTWIWASPVTMPDDAGFNDEDPPTKLVTYDWDEDNLEWTNKTTHTIDPDM